MVVISIVLRRVHMYAALFLIPWVLVYAISTIVMNHNSHFSGPFQELDFQTTLETSYEGTFSADTTPEQMAQQLLLDLDMDGRHRLPKRKKGTESETIVINRYSPLCQLRITYNPGEKTVVVEKAQFGARRFLRGMHTRFGYRYNSLKEDTWAASVDAFVIAMLFWIFSGLWMWWLMRKTRRLGWIAMVSGIALFVFFLVAI